MQIIKYLRIVVKVDFRENLVPVHVFVKNLDTL